LFPLLQLVVGNMRYSRHRTEDSIAAWLINKDINFDSKMHLKSLGKEEHTPNIVLDIYQMDVIMGTNKAPQTQELSSFNSPYNRAGNREIPPPLPS